MSLGIPPTGQQYYNGYPCHWRYDIARDSYLAEYMGARKMFDTYDLVKDPLIAQRWAEAVYQQQRGTTNGISRQATPSLPSNSAGSQSGNQYNQAQHSTAQYIAQQLASRQTNLQQQLQQQYLAGIANQQYSNPLSQAVPGAGAGIPVPAKPVKIEALKTDGIKLGEIIAFRGWKITAQGFLRSMSADVIWAPGEPMEGKTKSTEEHNGCYAYKTAREFLRNHENSGLDVYGKVALWGDIIEHELGYRAQFAKIVGLEHLLGNRASHDLDALRNRYCPRLAA